MRLALLMLFTTLAAAQSPRTHQDASALPDAPSVSLPSTSNSGYLWGPNGPHQADWHEMKPAPPKKAGFFTVRKMNAPALRTSGETSKALAFILPEAVMWGAGYTDVRVNRGHGNTPVGSALYIDAYVPLAIVSGAHFVFDRYISRAIGLAPVGYATTVHLKGAVTRVYP